MAEGQVEEIHHEFEAHGPQKHIERLEVAESGQEEEKDEKVEVSR